MSIADAALQWAAVPPDVLDIPLCLSSGQAFRWTRTWTGDWVGAVGPHAVRLRPEERGFWWQTLPEPARWDVVERYFALDVDLVPLARHWAAADARIEPSVRRWAGLRVLRQHPDEAFLAFACACCNTMVKIARSVSALARRYGTRIATIDGEAVYGFPRAEVLAAADEGALREDLWGYRAPRLIDLARIAAERGAGWLPSLAALPYAQAHAALVALPGIGPKIADCICLFGLRHDEAVPVDTHVQQVSRRWFPDLAVGPSLTVRRYQAVGDAWRERFGAYAGWAQQYAFMNEVAPGTPRGITV